MCLDVPNESKAVCRVEYSKGPEGPRGERYKSRQHACWLSMAGGSAWHCHQRLSADR